MAIDNDKLIGAIDTAAESAIGSETDGEVADSRERALRYYLGENINPAPPGRSQVVDRTVFEVVEAIIPSLVRIFASGDDVCKALPVGPDDREAADQTTALLQWNIVERNQWEQIVHDCGKDGLLLRNGYILAYWDNSKRIEHERYEGQSDEQLAVLMQDDDVTVKEHSQRPDEDQDERNAQMFQQQTAQWQQAAMQAQAQGQPVPPQPQQPQPAFLHDVVIERIADEGRPKLCVLPPEHCLVDRDAPDFTLQHANYFEFWEERTISQLRSMGLEVDDDITDNEDDDTPEDTARDRFGEQSWNNDAEVDPSMRKVRARMIWIRTDLENDGVARLYYVIRVGNEILYVEPCSRIPVGSWSPMPMPHRHLGLSMYDVSADIQDIKTSVHRGALDNLYLANNGRHIISDQVNLDDMLESRPGGLVRMQPGARPADGHVVPLVHPFAFDSILGAMNYFNDVQQTRTGVNRYFNGTDAGAMNRTATGISMLTTQSAQRVEQMARMMAVAVEHVFNVVLELIQKHANKQQTFQLRGKWFVVDPRAWATKRDLKISVGVGAGNKDSMLMQLQQMLGAQAQMLPLGIATPVNLYETANEIAKMQGFSQPERFWTDPRSVPPKPPEPPLPLVIEQTKSQSQEKIKQAELQLRAQSDERDRELEQWKARLEAETKMQIEQIKQGAPIQADNSLQIEMLRIESAERIKLMEMAANLLAKRLDGEENNDQQNTNQATIETLMAQIAALAGTLNAPKRVVRDQEGRIVGVESAPIQ